jgi:hypothetical protein
MVWQWFASQRRLPDALVDRADYRRRMHQCCVIVAQRRHAPRRAMTAHGRGTARRRSGFPYPRRHCLDHCRQHGVGQFRVDRQRQRFGGGAFARWQIAGTLPQVSKAFLQV